MWTYHVAEFYLFYMFYFDGMFQSKFSFTGHKGIICSYFTLEPKGTTLNMLS